MLQTFCDLRESAAAATSDDQKLESALSTAEQISVLEDAILHSNFFGDRTLRSRTLAQSLIGSLVQRTPEDVSIFNKFWHEVVAKHSKEKKGEWTDFLEGGRKTMSTMK